MHRYKAQTIIRGNKNTLRGVIMEAFTEKEKHPSIQTLVDKGLRGGYNVEEVFREIARLESDGSIREVNEMFEALDD